MNLLTDRIHTPMIVFVWLKREPGDCHALSEVKKMIGAAVGPYSNRALIWGDKQIAWGLLIPVNYSPLTTWSIYQDNDELCIYEGEMYDHIGDVRTCPGENPLIARYIAGAFNKNPEKIIDSMNGVFSGIYFDRKSNRALAFTDHSGIRPVYYFSDENSFIVSTNLWSFRGCSVFDIKLDEFAIAQKLTIGFPLSGRTWIDNVRQLKPGEIVEVKHNKGARTNSYLKPIQRKRMEFKRAIGFLREMLDSTMIRLSDRLDTEIGLALSGGLDSRIILASLHNIKIKSSNYTFCHKDNDPDNILSKKMCESLGLNHNSVLLNSSKAFSLYRDLIILNEGESTGFGYFLMGEQASRTVKNMLIGAEAVRDTPLGPFNPWKIKTKDELSMAVLSAQLNYFNSSELKKILNGTERNYWECILDEWNQLFNNIDNQSIIDIYLDYLLAYRMHRRTRPRHEQIRWFCMPVYPYMDRAVFNAFRTIPVKYIKCDRAHIELIKSYKTGIENFAHSARYSFKIPLGIEYKIYPVIQSLRVLKGKLIQQLLRNLHQLHSRLTKKSNVPVLTKEILICKEKSEIFNWKEVCLLFERAEQGNYIKKEALKKIIEIQIIDDMIHMRTDREKFIFLSSSLTDIEFVDY